MKKSNTNNINQDEVDALFREAANSFQPPDKKKEIWVLLEKRIKKNVWYLNRNIYLIAGAILILMLLSGVFIFNQIRKSKTTKKDLTEEVFKVQQSMKYNEKIKNRDSSINKNEPVYQEKNNDINIGNKSQLFIADNKSDIKEFKENNKTGYELPFINNTVLTTFSLERRGETHEQLQTVFPPESQYQHLFEAELINPVKDSIGSLASSKEIKNEKKEEITKRGPFSLQMIAGPDWSTVKLGQWGKPAWDIGLMTGYRFANRWTVQTGIITGGKDYNSYSTDFKFPDNTPDRDDINEVTTESHVLTVPLNIIYRLSQNQHHSFSIRMGLSSYWFLTEEYTYHYKSNTGLTDTHFEIENINKNIFSIMNISPIYEYYLNKNVSFIASPYFQLPFSKIGYGEVSMQSLGINVGAAYYF